MVEHYFSEKPQSNFKKEKFSLNILGSNIIINSGSGIFSLKKIDKGTQLLIENCKIGDNDSVLDLGCGYGIIGISLKKRYPNIKVTMIDINERAIKLAKQNCEENNVECLIYKSNIFSNPNIQDKKFDVILTNPPFNAGKKVCTEFILQSFEHLKPGGSLQLVAPHNKGGLSLRKIMLEKFGNVGELVKKSGYRVYISRKNY